MGPRSWLLSPQLTLQLSCSLVISSLFTLWRCVRINFSHRLHTLFAVCPHRFGREHGPQSKTTLG
jgi:hypothetical protein